MSACPHCGGEIRPSVIKCVHCGTSLVGEPQPAGVAPGVPAAIGVAGTPQPAPAPVASKPAGMPGRPTAPPPSVFDPPREHPARDPWVTPSVRADALVHLPATAPIASAALPVARTRRANGLLVVASLLAVASAIASATAMSLPWVAGSLWVVGDRPSPKLVAELTFVASDGFAGRVVVVVAIVLGLLGLVWFWYAMDRGVNLPALAHPGFALAAGAAAWGTLATARLGSFFWEPAFVSHAREAGTTKGVMRAILEEPAARRLELIPQTGMVRFGVASALAVVAGVVALWSQRARAYR